MTVIYISDEINRQWPGFSPTCLDSLAESIMTFSPPLTEEVYETIAREREHLFVIVAANPQTSVTAGHEYLPVELGNRDVNPGNVSYVDLNPLFISCSSEEQLVHRLQLQVELALVKLQQTASHPRVSHPPLKRMLIVGKPEEDTFITSLANQDIEVVTLWAGLPTDVAGEPSGLRGMPGAYTVDFAHGQEQRVGAIALFDVGFSAEQRTMLAQAFCMPLRNGRLHLLQHQIRRSQGIKVLAAGIPLAPVQAYFSALLHLQEIPHYIEDPLVDMSKCGLCGTCVKTCLFHASAIVMQAEAGISTIYPEYCVACGNCVTACPTGARDLPAYSQGYFTSVWQDLRRFTGDVHGLKILVIYCEANGHDAVTHLAATAQKVPEACLFFKIRCGARVDTQFIPDCFRAGFDGVVVAVCSRDECGNIVGSLDLERRLNLYRKVMQVAGIETGRMRIVPIASQRLDALAEALAQFAEFLEHLQQDKQLFTAILH